MDKNLEAEAERLFNQGLENLKQKSNISYENIRYELGKSYGVWNELDNGRKVLLNYKQFAQYWSSYQKFIPDQWKKFYIAIKEKELIPKPDIKVEIFDYGAGQGHATLLFLLNYYKDNKACINKITLIDSGIAVKLGKELIMIQSPTIPSNKISYIQKPINDISLEEIKSEPDYLKIHLFSNILDIPNAVDANVLLEKISKNKGKHLFLAVGHDRYFKGGTELVKAFEECIYNSKFGFKKIGKLQILSEDGGFKYEVSNKLTNGVYFMAYVKVE